MKWEKLIAWVVEIYFRLKRWLGKSLKAYFHVNTNCVRLSHCFIVLFALKAISSDWMCQCQCCTRARQCKRRRNWNNERIIPYRDTLDDVSMFPLNCESDFGNFLTALNMEIFTLSSIQCSRSPHRRELVRCSYGWFEIKISYESIKLLLRPMYLENLFCM